MNGRDFRLVTSNPNIHAQIKYIVGCLPKKNLIFSFFLLPKSTQCEKDKG